MRSDLMDQIVQLLGPEVQQFAGDLDGLEGGVEQLVRQVGRAVIQQAVEGRKNGYVGCFRRCRCGGRERFKGYRPKTVLTVFGVVKVHRGYYHCDGCGASSFPYDQASGLSDGALSNRLASAVSLLSVDISFEQASAKVQRLLGVRVDDNTVAATVERAGAAVMARQEQAIEQFQKTGQLAEPAASPSRL